MESQEDETLSELDNFVCSAIMDFQYIGDKIEKKCTTLKTTFENKSVENVEKRLQTLIDLLEKVVNNVILSTKKLKEKHHECKIPVVVDFSKLEKLLCFASALNSTQVLDKSKLSLKRRDTAETVDDIPALKESTETKDDCLPGSPKTSTTASETNEALRELDKMQKDLDELCNVNSEPDCTQNTPQSVLSDWGRSGAGKAIETGASTENDNNLRNTTPEAESCAIDTQESSETVSEAFAIDFLTRCKLRDLYNKINENSGNIQQIPLEENNDPKENSNPEIINSQATTVERKSDTEEEESFNLNLSGITLPDISNSENPECDLEEKKEEPNTDLKDVPKQDDSEMKTNFGHLDIKFADGVIKLDDDADKLEDKAINQDSFIDTSMEKLEEELEFLLGNEPKVEMEMFSVSETKLDISLTDLRNQTIDSEAKTPAQVMEDAEILKSKREFMISLGLISSPIAPNTSSTSGLLTCIRESPCLDITPTENRLHRRLRRTQQKSLLDQAKDVLNNWDYYVECDSYSDDLSSESDTSSMSEIEGDRKHKKKIRTRDYSDEIKRHELKECYVKVLKTPEIDQRLKTTEVNTQVEQESIGSVSQSLIDEINRLCAKPFKRRKSSSSDSDVRSVKPAKKRRKRLAKSISGSETSSLSGYSSDDESQEKVAQFPDDLNLNSPLPQSEPDADELLAEVFCANEHALSSSDSDFQDEETVEKKLKIKPKPKTAKEDSETKIKDQDDALETCQKKSWRNDPLLREGNLPKESDGEMDDFKKHKRKGKKGSEDESYNLDESTDIYTVSELDTSNSDSDSSFTSFKKTNTSSPKFKQKCIDALGSDSDLEIFDISDGNEVSIVSVEDPNDDESQKRRRKNIRAVILDKDLAEATQLANKEEEERVIRLEKMHEKILNHSQSQSLEAELILDVHTENGQTLEVTVDPKLYKRMFAHQEEGVKFMWEACYESIEVLRSTEGSGCILAHCMGLGKTFQVFCLIHTLFSYKVTNTKHVLVICPLSTVPGWEKELKNGLKMAKNAVKINIFIIGPKDSKHNIIRMWKKSTGVLVMGYETFETSTNPKKMEKLSKIHFENNLQALINPGPDLIVCDEGHLLRNGNTLRTKALMKVKTRRRIILTGTPLQNNLKEYYYMIQFVKPNLLGTYKEYSNRFVNPITNGQYDDSSEFDIKLMKKRSHVLHKLMKNTIQRFEVTELNKELLGLEDFAIFIQLHPLQEELYKQFITTVLELKAATNANLNKGFFSDYQIAKYICTHPRLLEMQKQEYTKQRKRKERDVISQDPENFEDDNCSMPKDWWKSMCPDDLAADLNYSSKLKVAWAIIEEAEKVGDKVLIFSNSLLELDTFEYFLQTVGTEMCKSWQANTDYFRMDGTIPPAGRARMCDLFNDPKRPKLRIFLMSQRVGGLGLNLTAANRVILLGVNFNPSYDSQSIFRSYRYGQTKKVFVYRLISLGTMEEKVYQRCVTKLAVASRVVDKHQIDRHYKTLELREMYKYNFDFPERPTPSIPKDDILSKILLQNENIYKYHEHNGLLENRPHEDLNEEEKKIAWEEFQKEGEIAAQKNNLVPTSINTDITAMNLSTARPMQLPSQNLKNKQNRASLHVVGNHVILKEMSNNLAKGGMDLTKNLINPYAAAKLTGTKAARSYENMTTQRNTAQQSLLNPAANKTMNLLKPTSNVSRGKDQNNGNISKQQTGTETVLRQLMNSGTSVVIPSTSASNNRIRGSQNVSVLNNGKTITLQPQGPLTSNLTQTSQRAPVTIVPVTPSLKGGASNVKELSANKKQIIGSHPGNLIDLTEEDKRVDPKIIDFLKRNNMSIEVTSAEKNKSGSYAASLISINCMQ